MTPNAPASSFRDAVEDALKHFDDPAWLGEHAPLAAPYLLARYLDARVDAPIARGRVLQDLLKRAAAQLDGKQGERSQKILEQYYFRGLRVDAVCDSLGLSRATFHASRNAAIESLVDVLTREIQPALTLDAVPHAEGELFGRSDEEAACLAALYSRSTVLVTGSGGMGKTSFAGRVAHTWGARSVCWFTIRPGLTDHLTTLLLHLGYFFRQHNAPALWQEMIAAQGTIDLKIVLGLVRFTLEQPRPHPLLLCIDEIDLLQASVYDEHAHLLTFVQSLRGLMPLLFVGQRSTLEADRYIALAGLSADPLNQWLLERRVRLSAEEQEQLQRYTGGAPHLIQLFITLQQTGEPLGALLPQLAAAPTLASLLGRVLQRLSDAERQFLMQLAVLQVPLPADAWQQKEAAGALHLLVERHLVQRDEFNRVWLLPVYRDHVRDALSPLQMTALHARAAALFAERGQYTIAAYHYCQAGQPEAAVLLWRQHQEAEINQGQAHVARLLFQEIAPESLPAAASEMLHLLLARLAHLTGSGAQARTALQARAWRTPLLAIEAAELSGIIASDQGDYESARASLDDGLASAEYLLEARMARMLKGKAWSYVKERNLAAAWKETQLAAYEVENLKGLLHEEACEYLPAERHFRDALMLAQELAHEQGIAKSSANLSGLYARLGRHTDAMEYWRTAYASYLRLGKAQAVAGCMINLGFLHNLAREHAAAMQAAQDVETYLSDRAITAPRPLRSVIEQVKAEAALGLGEFSEAEAYARQAIEVGGDFIAPDATRTLAEVQLAYGNVTDAVVLIDDAVVRAQATDDRYLEAYAWRAAARIYAAIGESAAARRAASTAADLFAALNLPHEAAKT